MSQELLEPNNSTIKNPQFSQGDLQYMNKRIETFSSDKKGTVRGELDSNSLLLPGFSWPQIVNQKQKFFSSNENTGTTGAWTVFDNKVYDIAPFIHQHPGGQQILKNYIGKDCTKAFNGSEYNDSHIHSSSALDILQDFLVGKVIADDSDDGTGKGMGNQQHKPLELDGSELRKRLTHRHKRTYGIDIEEPLIPQVMDMSTKEYLKWINDPFPGTARLFRLSWMEDASRTAWTTVPTVWVPFILSMIYLSLSVPESMGLLALFISFCVGELLWMLFEYGMHRYVFHWTPRPFKFFEGTSMTVEPIPEKFLRVFHFLLHGVHHVMPMDGDRLVAPILFSFSLVSLFVLIPFIIPLCMIVYSLNRHLFGLLLSWVFGAAAGMANGYLRYDLIHYFLHHGESTLRPIQYLKSKHMAHHYDEQCHERYFGVSNPLLDFAMGTS